MDTVHEVGLVLSMLAECGLFPMLPDPDEEEDAPNEERVGSLRIEGYVERIIPNLTAKQFQEHFRMNRQAFERILPVIHELIKKQANMGRPAIDTERQLLAVLWLLATPDSYRSVGERFNMGKSSLSNSFFRIIKALNIMAARVITWPLTRLQQVEQKFRRMAGINGVIGAIDGTYIPIKAPTEHPESYITRKCHYAITLQAICDSYLKYTDCFVGYPGSVSDTRIFRNSDIYHAILDNRDRYFPNNEFIVGDKAYPCLNFLLPPYIDRGNLNAAHRNYNTKISQTRQTIERSFALLFGRFRRLKFLDMNCLQFIPATVLAACVLHNLCIDSNDVYIEQYILEGIHFVHLNDDDEVIAAGYHGRGEQQENGALRRDTLRDMLFQNM